MAAAHGHRPRRGDRLLKQLFKLLQRAKLGHRSASASASASSGSNPLSAAAARPARWWSARPTSPSPRCWPRSTRSPCRTRGSRPPPSSTSAPARSTTRRSSRARSPSSPSTTGRCSPVEVDPTSTAKTTAAVDAALTAKLPSTLEMLNPAPAQDSDSMTVTAATAAKYHLKSIADLKPYASELGARRAVGVQDPPRRHRRAQGQLRPHVQVASTRWTSRARSPWPR